MLLESPAVRFFAVTFLVLSRCCSLASTSNIKVIPPHTSQPILASTPGNSSIIMFAGYSTANLSLPAVQTNAMWQFHFANLSWNRISANGTPTVPFLSEIQGSTYRDTLYVAGIDNNLNPPAARVFSFDLSDIGKPWQEIQHNITFDEIFDSKFSMVATPIGLTVLGDFSVVNASNSVESAEIRTSAPSKSCSRIDLVTGEWIRCSDIPDQKVLAASVAYNRNFNWVLAYGGFTDHGECCSNGIVHRYSEIGHPWYSEVTRDDLPSRLNSCVLPYNDGFVVYGGTVISNAGWNSHHNDMYYLSFSNTSIMSTNLTHPLSAMTQPRWKTAPSCIIIDSVIYLIGLPDLPKTSSDINNRIVALNISNPIAYFTPGNEPSEIEDSYMNLIVGVAVLGFTLAFVILSGLYIYLNPKHPATKMLLPFRHVRTPIIVVGENRSSLDELSVISERSRLSAPISITSVDLVAVREDTLKRWSDHVRLGHEVLKENAVP